MAPMLGSPVLHKQLTPDGSALPRPIFPEAAGQQIERHLERRAVELRGAGAGMCHGPTFLGSWAFVGYRPVEPGSTATFL